MASEWQTVFVVSQNAMVCLAHCRQELQQKSWKKLQDFFVKTETKNKTKSSRHNQDKISIFVLEAPRDQNSGLENYITGKA